MCSGTEGNGLAPICPELSGEEFLIVSEVGAQQGFASLHRVCVRVRGMGTSHVMRAKKANAKKKKQKKQKQPNFGQGTNRLLSGLWFKCAAQKK